MFVTESNGKYNVLKLHDRCLHSILYFELIDTVYIEQGILTLSSAWRSPRRTNVTEIT